MICIELPHYIFLLQCSMVSHRLSLLVLFAAILSQPLLILIFPLILFHQFQKFSKLLYPFQLHLLSIQRFTIHLKPIKHIMLINPMLRRIPFVGLNKSNHLIEPTLPSFVLPHLSPPAYLIIDKRPYHYWKFISQNNSSMTDLSAFYILLNSLDFHSSCHLT